METESLFGVGEGRKKEPVLRHTTHGLMIHREKSGGKGKLVLLDQYDARVLPNRAPLGNYRNRPRQFYDALVVSVQENTGALQNSSPFGVTHAEDSHQ